MTEHEQTIWQALKNLGRPTMREADRALIFEQNARAAREFFHKAWGRAKEAPRTGDAMDYDKQAFTHVQFWLDQVLTDR